MTKGWTEERRKAQAERIRRNKPWEKSTGPKTARGKKRSSMNAFKHGERSRSVQLARIIFRHNRACLKAFNEYVRLIRTSHEIMSMSSEVIRKTIISETYKDKEYFSKQTDEENYES